VTDKGNLYHFGWVAYSNISAKYGTRRNCTHSTTVGQFPWIVTGITPVTCGEPSRVGHNSQFRSLLLYTSPSRRQLHNEVNCEFLLLTDLTLNLPLCSICPALCVSSSRSRTLVCHSRSFAIFTMNGEVIRREFAALSASFHPDGSTSTIIRSGKAIIGN